MSDDELIELNKPYYWTKEVAILCGLSKRQFNREILPHRQRLNHFHNNKRWYLYQVKLILDLFARDYIVTLKRGSRM